MSLTIKHSTGQQPLTYEVWYKEVGSDGLPPVGGMVCWDHTETLTPAAGEFPEQIRHKVVTKPKTANLPFFAGYVTDIKSYPGNSGNSGVISITVPHKGHSAQVLTKSNQTSGTSLLTVVNDSWNLENDAGFDADTVGKAMETVNTSVTAAISSVCFV